MELCAKILALCPLIRDLFLAHTEKALSHMGNRHWGGGCSFAHRHCGQPLVCSGGRRSPGLLHVWDSSRIHLLSQHVLGTLDGPSIQKNWLGNTLHESSMAMMLVGEYIVGEMGWYWSIEKLWW